jgi:phosphatidylinositol glycan class F
MSAVANEVSAQGVEAKAKPTIAPVPIVDNTVSKSLALLRPGFLLSLLALNFDALVANPVSTLQLALPAVALIQAAYAVICLPVAGSQTAKVVKKSRPGEKKKIDGIGSNTVSVRKSWFFRTSTTKLFLTLLTPAVSETRLPLSLYS